MNHFKRPLIATVIAIAAAMVIGIGGVTWIYQSNLSNRKKTERAEILGTAVGFGAIIVVFPFWIAAAARVGKERRERRDGKI